jgi:hypothetical protein
MKAANAETFCMPDYYSHSKLLQAMMAGQRFSNNP